VSTRRAGLTPANIYTTFPRFLLSSSDSSRAPYLEFASPYLPPHSLTTNFVNGFHSAGFSRSIPFLAPRPGRIRRSVSLSSRRFAALIARLFNCHFLRQIVLSRVGVTDTRIKLAEKKRRRRKRRRRKKERKKKRESGGENKKREKGGGRRRDGRVV